MIYSILEKQALRSTISLRGGDYTRIWILGRGIVEGPLRGSLRQPGMRTGLKKESFILSQNKQPERGSAVGMFRAAKRGAEWQLAVGIWYEEERKQEIRSMPDRPFPFIRKANIFSEVPLEDSVLLSWAIMGHLVCPDWKCRWVVGI